MRYLPEELIRECIMPYCYTPQSAGLLRDIRSFTTDMDVIMLTVHDDRDIDILLNQLIYFCNGSRNIHETQTVQMGDIIRRNIQFTNRYGMEIYDHIMELTHAPSKKHCRYLWGLLSPIERTRFINRFIIEDIDQDQDQDMYHSV